MSTKPYLSNKRFHRLIHIGCKVILAIQVMLCVEFFFVAIIKGIFGLLLAIPLVALIAVVLFQTILKTKHIRGDQSGFEIYHKEEWKPYLWKDVIDFHRPYWGFNPFYPVFKITLQQGKHVLFFGKHGTKEKIQSYLQAEKST